MARGHPINWVDKEGNIHTILDTHKDFIDEYLANGYNARKAYKDLFMKEGGNTSNSNKFFWAEDSQEYLKHERQRIFDERNIDKLRILDKLADIAFAEKGDKDYNTGHQLKALEMLGKMGGLCEESSSDNGKRIIVSLEK